MITPRALPTSHQHPEPLTPHNPNTEHTLQPVIIIYTATRAEGVGLTPLGRDPVQARAAGRSGWRPNMHRGLPNACNGAADLMRVMTARLVPSGGGAGG